MRKRQRFPQTRLTVVALEDRCTPATHLYTAATQTLTITAAEGDHISVGRDVADPPDYLIAKDSSGPIFENASGDHPVRNLIVRFNNVENGELMLYAVNFSGSVAVLGAKSSQTMSIWGDVDGNLTYTATGNAFDHVKLVDTWIYGAVNVDGNVTLNLGGGINYVDHYGGRIGGNFAINSGNGADTISLHGGSGHIVVGGSMGVRLNGGANRFDSENAGVLDIGGNLVYAGAAGRDLIDLVSFQTQVGGAANFTLGKAPAAQDNLIALGEIAVGGNMNILGDTSADTLRFHKDLTLIGNFTANLGGGKNYLNFSQFGGASNTIDGRLTYVGGNGRDQVYVDGTSVGTDASFALGTSTDNDQFIRIGQGDVDGVHVQGALTITAGATNDRFSLRRLYVGKNLTLRTGDGEDQVRIDDVEIRGLTLIEMAAGNDLLEIEMMESDGQPLDAKSVFAGKFTLRAGAGLDTVNFSRDEKTMTKVHFEDYVSLIGGAGYDSFINSTNNQFVVPGNFTDFEDADPLP